MENLSIGNKLAELRENLSLTQDEVAKSLGISNKTLSKWELGTSEPNLEMLTKLSKYYNVSTDYILGIKNEEIITPEAVIRQQFQEETFKNAILKSYELSFEMLCSKHHGKIAEADKKIVVPSSEVGGGARSYLKMNEEFELFVNTDEVSMFVQLLGNRDNFSWLGKDEIQEKLSKLFSFLSKKEALKVIKLIHTNTTSRNISASFAAQNIGISEERAAEILDEACDASLCYKKTAHLKDKDVNIYISDGSGTILSLVTLAYEHMCGRNYNNYAYGFECRLIEGEKI